MKQFVEWTICDHISPLDVDRLIPIGGTAEVTFFFAGGDAFFSCDGRGQWYTGQVRPVRTDKKESWMPDYGNAGSKPEEDSFTVKLIHPQDWADREVKKWPRGKCRVCGRGPFDGSHIVCTASIAKWGNDANRET